MASRMNKKQCDDRARHQAHMWGDFLCSGYDPTKYVGLVTPASDVDRSRAVGRIEADDIEQVCEVIPGHTYVKFTQGKGRACSCGLGNITVEVVQ